MNQIILPDSATKYLCDTIRHYGQHDMETGGLLLTRPDEPEVEVVALAGTSGIIRKYGLFVITRPAFDAIFSWAEDNSLQVRAMIHSHAQEAFLSLTDQEGGLRVRGFISAVVPTFADPPQDPRTWGWWTYTSDWTPTPAPTRSTTGTVNCVIFDGEGVHVC